jgi:hypothetical protein
MIDEDRRREIYQRAHGLLRERDLHEAAYARWEEQHAAQLADQACDLLLDKLQRQREVVERQNADGNLVFKTKMTPPRLLLPDDDEPVRQVSDEPILTDETTALADMIGELQAQIDEIRAEIAELRAAIGGSNTGRVVSLPRLQLRGRDAA